MTYKIVMVDKSVHEDIRYHEVAFGLGRDMANTIINLLNAAEPEENKISYAVSGESEMKYPSAIVEELETAIETASQLLLQLVAAQKN